MDETKKYNGLTDNDAEQLELRLGDLAMNFRGAKGDIQRREEIVHEYHAIISKLYQNGRNPSLDLDSELPDKFMPEEYLRRTRPSRYSK
jgi:hypothetical protein